MRSNNPIFNNAEGFNRAPSVNAYGNTTYAGNGAGYSGFGTPQAGGATFAPTAPTPAMTMDSVVRASAITFGALVISAILTWVLTPAFQTDAFGNITTNMRPLQTAMVLSVVGSLVLWGINAFTKMLSPITVVLYAAAQGVALGAISKFFDFQYAHGIVVQAVLGTIVAFGATLAAYKFMGARLGSRMRMFIQASAVGIFGLAIVEILLNSFGSSTHLFDISPLGTVVAVIGLVVGIGYLLMDFEFVENGIANGLPEKNSWVAAFGLTISLVWIYQNLLRILAFFSRR